MDSGSNLQGWDFFLFKMLENSQKIKNANRHRKNLWTWWGSVEVRRLNQSRPTAVLPSSARQD